MKWLFAVLTLVTQLSMAQAAPNGNRNAMKEVEHLKDFQVFELRRYTIKDGEREHFAQYFESYFPEAFEQLGALAIGQFFEREKANHFLWMRAFHDMDDRAKLNSLFYYGPLWKEHKATLNAIIDDSDNVLLLHPLYSNRPITVMPAVDPVTEPSGAHVVAVALVFAVKPNSMEQFARDAEAMFTKYRDAGIQEVGVLSTLDAKNNFPQLPVRTDGQFLVWLGLMADDGVLTKTFLPLYQNTAKGLQKSQLLTGPTELIVLDPTKRSRLRWLPL